MFEGWQSFLVFLAACFVAATSGGMFGPDDWYERLKKPPWNPPNWLFPVAWTPLYIMIAVSGWLVWRTSGGLAGGEAMWVALGVYGLQLVLNASWSPLFFGLKRMDLAFAELILLWASIAALIVLFYPINALSAYLLVPYLAWGTFAGVLNWSVWQRNRGAGGSDLPA